MAYTCFLLPSPPPPRRVNASLTLARARERSGGRDPTLSARSQARGSQKVGDKDAIGF